MKSKDAMYQYSTDCSNGLQLDCFDTRFAESRPKWKGYLKRGLVYPRGFIVLESSPNTRKYNRERCALNVVEEKNLVKDLAKAHVGEHATSVLMDDSYIAVVNAKRSHNFTSNQMKSMSVRLRKAQEEVAKCIMVVADCKARIHNIGLVCNI